jgi:hypothetical protein
MHLNLLGVTACHACETEFCKFEIDLRLVVESILGNNRDTSFKVEHGSRFMLLLRSKY